MTRRRMIQGIRRRTCFTNPRKVVMVFGIIYATTGAKPQFI